MKKQLLYVELTVLILVCMLIPNALNAQIIKTTFNFEKPAVVNFSELAKYEKDHPVILQPRFIEQGEDRDKFIFKPNRVEPGAKTQNIILPKTSVANALSNSPSPSQNFQGILDNGTLIPPDINGAVGTTYAMETTNQQFNIYTKSTGALKSTVTITTLFSASGLSGYYDPHIVYDPTSDRFMIGIDAGGGTSSSPSYFALAVSATGDPTATWYIYKVECTPSSTSDFMDYPMLGFSSNWVVMTGNDFPLSGANSTHIYVWPKATLYAGGAGTATSFVDNAHLLVSPASTYDAGVSTVYMVSDYNGNSGGNGYVNIGTITGTTTPIYTAGSQLGINQPWQEPTSLAQAPQQGSTHGIEAGDTRVHSCIYRNSSLWFTHTVFLPASGTVTNGAVDWWQINPSALSVTQFGRIADPLAKIWYYYPSLDVNSNGDMLVGYSTSSSTTYAGAQYALRLVSDAVNTLEPSVQFVNGVASYYKTYGGGRNRWGDFSGTAFDPVDNSFWTFQEWANTSNNWGTQIAHIPNTGITPCNTPIGTVTSNIANTTATFGWSAVSGATGYNIQYRIVGTTTWSTGTSATNSYNATGLTLGTNYEWQVQTVCSATSTSSFSASVNFTTTGGCAIPTGLNISAITTSSATLGWGAVTGAVTYNLQWGASKTALTTVSSLTSNSYALSGLTAGTKYYFDVQTVCTSGSSNYSALDSFTTTSNITYCSSKGTTTREYINKVVLGSINNTVANDGGYGNYTNLSTNLTAGTSYTITLTPGFNGSSRSEHWTVYIDYNQDGILNGTGEIVATGSGRSAKNLTFTVPITSKNGSTRLRIQMQYNTTSTNPCATLSAGDVQDYTVNISGGTGAPVFYESVIPVTTETLNKLIIVPNPVSGNNATAHYNLENDGNVILKIIDLNGKVVYNAALGIQNAGAHNYLLSNMRLITGYYIIVLEQNNQIISKNRFIVN